MHAPASIPCLLPLVLFPFFFAFFAPAVPALPLYSEDSGFLVKYKYGIVAPDYRSFTVGERGGTDGNFGEGYTSFDHGRCVVSRTGNGNLGGECDLPNVRDFGAPYMVMKVLEEIQCSGVSQNTSNMSAVIALAGTIDCKPGGAYAAEFFPTAMSSLRAQGRGHIETSYRSTAYMGFSAKSGFVEYVGTANRGFLRFDLSDLNDSFFSASLNLFVEDLQTDFGLAEGKISLHSIDDYGFLDKDDYDFVSLAELSPDLLAGGSSGYLSFDVTQALLDARAAGQARLAFALQNSVEDFDGNSRFVLIGGYKSGNPPFLDLKPNSPPTVQVLQPNGAETLSDLAGRVPLRFRFSDPDRNQAFFADLYLSEAPGAQAELLAANVALDAGRCTDADQNPATPNECVFEWLVPPIQRKNAYLDVVVRDSLGAASSDSSDSPFMVDGLAPQNGRLKILKADDNCHVTSPVIDLSLEAEDISPLAVSFSCDNRQFSDPVAFAPVVNGFNLSGAAPGCNDSDGNKLVFARFTDALGHATDYPIVDTLYLDREAPQLSILAPSQGATLASSTVNVSFEATDTGGLKDISARLDTQPSLDLGLAQFHAFTGLSWGLHSVAVRATDIAGNYSEETVSFVVGETASVSAPPLVASSVRLEEPPRLPAPALSRPAEEAGVYIEAALVERLAQLGLKQIEAAVLLRVAQPPVGSAQVAQVVALGGAVADLPADG